MRDKHSSKTIFITIVALVVGIVGVTGLVMATDKPNPGPLASHTQAADHDVKTATTKQFSYLKYGGVDGSTAMELLKKQATTVTKDSSFGEYVDSINGVVGGTDNKYWSYYINGSLATEGAASYVTKSTDTIEWKFE